MLIYYPKKSTSEYFDLVEISQLLKIKLNDTQKTSQETKGLQFL